MSQTPLSKVLDAINQAGLAGKLGITRQAVNQWKRKGQIPVERVREIERITGIPRVELRPDIYGDAA